MKQFWKDWLQSDNPGSVVFSAEGRAHSQIADLKGVPQEFEWHPEGDADIHTANVVNEAFVISRRENLPPEEHIVLAFAALGHDFAKANCTEVKMRNGVERITSEGHEKAGGPMVRAFMEDIGVDEAVIAQVVPLVENHLVHIIFDKDIPTLRVLRRLRARLEPSNVRMLSWLIEADVSGRSPAPKMMPEAAKRMVERLENLPPDEPESPPSLVQGKHLIELGMKPGPQIGAILKELADREENGDFDTLEEGILIAKEMIK